MSPGRRQAIISTNAGILLIGRIGTNFNEILSEIHIFSFQKTHFNLSSGKCRPFCFGLNELKLVSLQFPAHRLVLASHSPYFEKMFKSPLMEGSQSTIRLHETQPEYFKLLLEFMYSGRLAITDGNVKVSNGKSFSQWVRSFQLKVALPLACDSVRSLL